MWSAELVEKQMVGGVLQVAVRYTDGASSFTDVVGLSAVNSSDQLEKMVSQRLRSLENLSSLKADLKTGAVEIKESAPSQADLNVQAFVADVSKLKKLLNAVALGLKASDDTELVALQDKLKAQLTDELLNVL